MTEPSKHERKKLFAEINGSLKEYSTIEDISTLESVKEEILQLLKTHRPVKRCDYEYGLSRTLNKDHRLIIKELADGSRVRQYYKMKNLWYCTTRDSCKCKSSALRIQYGIVFAPIDHVEKCNTRDYSYVMEIQGLLKQGKTKEAHGLTCRQRYRKSIPSSSSSTFDESALLNADQDDSSISEHPYFTNVIAASIASSSTPESSPILAPNLSESTASSSVKRESNNVDDNDEDCMILEKPVIKKPKTEENITTTDTFKFICPSSTVLQQKCEKLKIEYTSAVYMLWAQMVFSNILPAASTFHTHSLKSPNIFACLSLLFTGETDDCFLIQHVVNKAFREDLLASGTKSREEIEEILMNNVVSDDQIEFMAKFLSCRIGIYYDGALKKFGKWEHGEKEDILTLILLFHDGCFSVVLDLSINV